MIPVYLPELDPANQNTRSMINIMEVVYTWPDGRQEVRYRRTAGTREAIEFVAQVDAMRKRLGDECPYSYRHAVGTDEG